MKKNIKVYIHVGFHKTGTTAIQHFLNMNYKNLIKQGILYPLEIRLMFEKARYAHHGIAWYFGFGGDLTPIDEIRNMGIGAKQILESLHKEINQNKKKSVIISSEVFSENFDEKKFCKVFDLFSGFSVYVIYYIRRQDNYVISDFKHRVTHFGYSQPIEEMLGRQNLDYYNRIKFISNLLGKENIFVRVYEEVDPAGSIFEDLLSCVGGRLNKSFKFPPKLQSNRGLVNDYIEFMHIINTHFSQTEQKKIRTLLRKSEVRPKDSTSLLSPQERLKIITDNYESNLKVAREFLGRDDLYNPSSIDVTKLPEKHTFKIEDFIQVVLDFSNKQGDKKLRPSLQRMLKRFTG